MLFLGLGPRICYVSYVHYKPDYDLEALITKSAKNKQLHKSHILPQTQTKISSMESEYARPNNNNLLADDSRLCFGLEIKTFVCNDCLNTVKKVLESMFTQPSGNMAN